MIVYCNSLIKRHFVSWKNFKKKNENWLTVEKKSMKHLDLSRALVPEWFLKNPGAYYDFDHEKDFDPDGMSIHFRDFKPEQKEELEAALHKTIMALPRSFAREMERISSLLPLENAELPSADSLDKRPVSGEVVSKYQFDSPFDAYGNVTKAYLPKSNLDASDDENDILLGNSKKKSRRKKKRTESEDAEQGFFDPLLFPEEEKIRDRRKLLRAEKKKDSKLIKKFTKNKAIIKDLKGVKPLVRSVLKEGVKKELEKKILVLVRKKKNFFRASYRREYNLRLMKLEWIKCKIRSRCLGRLKKIFAWHTIQEMRQLINCDMASTGSRYKHTFHSHILSDSPFLIFKKMKGALKILKKRIGLKKIKLDRQFIRLLNFHSLCRDIKLNFRRKYYWGSNQLFVMRKWLNKAFRWKRSKVKHKHSNTSPVYVDLDAYQATLWLSYYLILNKLAKGDHHWLWEKRLHIVVGFIRDSYPNNKKRCSLIARQLITRDSPNYRLPTTPGIQSALIRRSLDPEIVWKEVKNSWELRKSSRIPKRLARARQPQVILKILLPRLIREQIWIFKLAMDKTNLKKDPSLKMKRCIHTIVTSLWRFSRVTMRDQSARNLPKNICYKGFSISAHLTLLRLLHSIHENEVAEVLKNVAPREMRRIFKKINYIYSFFPSAFKRNNSSKLNRSLRNSNLPDFTNRQFINYNIKNKKKFVALLNYSMEHRSYAFKMALELFSRALFGQRGSPFISANHLFWIKDHVFAEFKNNSENKKYYDTLVNYDSLPRFKQLINSILFSKRFFWHQLYIDYYDDKGKRRVAYYKEDLEGRGHFFNSSKSKLLQNISLRLLKKSAKIYKNRILQKRDMPFVKDRNSSQEADSLRRKLDNLVPWSVNFNKEFVYKARESTWDHRAFAMKKISVSNYYNPFRKSFFFSNYINSIKARFDDLKLFGKLINTQFNQYLMRYDTKLFTKFAGSRGLHPDLLPFNDTDSSVSTARVKGLSGFFSNFSYALHNELSFFARSHIFTGAALGWHKNINAFQTAGDFQSVLKTYSYDSVKTGSFYKTEFNRFWGINFHLFNDYGSQSGLERLFGMDLMTTNFLSLFESAVKSNFNNYYSCNKWATVKFINSLTGSAEVSQTTPRVSILEKDTFAAVKKSKKLRRRIMKRRSWSQADVRRFSVSFDSCLGKLSGSLQPFYASSVNKITALIGAASERHERLYGFDAWDYFDVFEQCIDINYVGYIKQTQALIPLTYFSRMLSAAARLRIIKRFAPFRNFRGKLFNYAKKKTFIKKFSRRAVLSALKLADGTINPVKRSSAISNYKRMLNDTRTFIVSKAYLDRFHRIWHLARIVVPRGVLFSKLKSYRACRLLFINNVKICRRHILERKLREATYGLKPQKPRTHRSSKLKPWKKKKSVVKKRVVRKNLFATRFNLRFKPRLKKVMRRRSKSNVFSVLSKSLSIADFFSGVSGLSKKSLLLKTEGRLSPVTSRLAKYLKKNKSFVPKEFLYLAKRGNLLHGKSDIVDFDKFCRASIKCYSTKSIAKSFHQLNGQIKKLAGGNSSATAGEQKALVCRRESPAQLFDRKAKTILNLEFLKVIKSHGFSSSASKFFSKLKKLKKLKARSRKARLAINALLKTYKSALNRRDEAILVFIKLFKINTTLNHFKVGVFENFLYHSKLPSADDKKGLKRLLKKSCLNEIKTMLNVKSAWKARKKFFNKRINKPSGFYCMRFSLADHLARSLREMKKSVYLFNKNIELNREIYTNIVRFNRESRLFKDNVEAKGRSVFIYFPQKRSWIQRKWNRPFKLLASVSTAQVWGYKEKAHAMRSIYAARKFFNARRRARAKHYRQKVFIKKILRRKFICSMSALKTRWKRAKETKRKWFKYYDEFERGLANTLCLIGFYDDIESAKDAIICGAVRVNNAIFTNPDYHVKPMDVISIDMQIYMELRSEKIIDIVKRHMAKSDVPNDVKRRILGYGARFLQKHATVARLKGSGYSVTKFDFFSRLLRAVVTKLVPRDDGYFHQRGKFIGGRKHKRKYGKENYYSLGDLGTGTAYHKMNVVPEAVPNDRSLTPSKIRRILTRAIRDELNGLYSSNVTDSIFYKNSNVAIFFRRPHTIQEFFECTNVASTDTYNPEVIEEFYTSRFWK